MHKMLLLLLFFLPLAHGGVEIWSVTVMHVVSIIIFAFWVFSLIRNGHIKLYRTPLDIPLLFFIIYLIVSLSFSIYPYATRIQLYRIINYIGIFYFLINILRDENIISHREVKDNENSRGILPRLSGKMPDLFSFHVLRDKYVFSSQTLVLFTSYLAVLGALYGIAGLLFNTGNFLGFWIFSFDDFSFTFRNHNHFAGYMNMITFLCIGLAIYYNKTKRILFIGLATASATTVLFSLSRGGIIGFLSGFFFFSAINIFLNKKRGFYMVSVFVILIIFTTLLQGSFNTVLYRMNTLQTPSISGADRLHLWKDVLNMLKDNLLTGTGIGTFAYAYPLYQTYEGWIIKHAHNEYLEIISETGLIGGVLLFLCIMMLFIYVVRGAISQRLSGIGIGALCACISILIHELFDFNLDIPSNAMLFAVCSAIALTSASISDGKSSKYMEISLKKNKVFCYSITGVIFLISLVFVISPYIASIYQNSARTYQLLSDYAPAYRALKKAKFFDPGNADILAAAGDLLVNRAVFSKENEEKNRFLLESLRYYDEAIKKVSLKSYFYSKKAYALKMLNRFDEAEMLLKKAIQLDKSDNELYYGVAELYLESGRLNEALERFKEYIIRMGGGGYLLMILDEMWDYTKGYNNLSKAVPEDARMRDAFAGYLWKKGMHDAAVQEFAYAYKLSPSVERALTHLQFLANTERFIEGYEFCKRYLSDFNDNIQLFKKLAWYSLRIGRHDEAISALGRLIKLDSNNSIDYRLSIAKTYCDTGRSLQGLGIINMLEKKASSNPELYFIKAECYRALGRYDIALEAREKAVFLKPDNTNYLFNIGFDYLANGLHEKAFKSWEECIRLDPSHQGCREWIKKHEDTHSQ